jgi:hypothetical protein
MIGLLSEGTILVRGNEPRQHGDGAGGKPTGRYQGWTTQSMDSSHFCMSAAWRVSRE